MSEDLMIQNPKKLVAIVVNYNGLEDTLECLQSIYASTLVPTVLVVDQHSACKELKEIKDKYPQTVGLQLNQNLGYANGVNAGLRWAIDHQYDYVAMMNNDTVVSPELFATLLESAEPKSLLTAFIYRYENRSVVWYGGGEINRITGGVKHWGKAGKSVRHNDFYCTFATGCFAVMPISLVKDVGYLNEDFYMYCEDVDYCIRLQNKGYRIKVVAQAKLWHKVSRKTGGSTSPFQNYYISRNRLMCVDAYRSYYRCTAKLFTLIGRLLRALKYFQRRNPAYLSIAKGVSDYYRGKAGSCNQYIV